MGGFCWSSGHLNRRAFARKRAAVRVESELAFKKDPGKPGI